MKGPAAHSSSRLRPVWDYTLCTLVNDLHISERLTGSQTNQTPQRPREMPYRDLLGVKCFTDRGQELVRSCHQSRKCGRRAVAGEQSSSQHRISMVVPLASRQWVKSACQRSFGCWAANRM